MGLASQILISGANVLTKPLRKPRGLNALLEHARTFNAGVPVDDRALCSAAHRIRSERPSDMAGAPVQVECQMGEGILACAHPVMQLLDVNIAKLWCQRRSGWSPSWWRPDDGFVFERTNVPNLGERAHHAMFHAQRSR